ncbi:endoglucanase E-4-like [Homarus americanus]|uniref:endoglucanase E-4-like n=1 Tax=Homarus americanus TaxID=6706 RepID=UPI001C49582D|nr:endoglucanase E-4-like [Homarus americanus]
MTSVLVHVLLGVVSLTLLHTVVEAEMCEVITIIKEAEGTYGGNFTSETLLPINGLDVIITFDKSLEEVTYVNGDVEKIDDTHFRILNSEFYETGSYVEFTFEVTFSGSARPDVVGVELNEQDACDGQLQWTTVAPYTNPCEATGMGKYDYAQALCMGILFYEAQRSGKLPEDQRVQPWRWDSAMDDGADVGHDLAGGYYDAGDHVKFGFPMAFTATALAWGLIDFAEGYEAAGQTDYGRAAVKWATDYFLKAHTAEYELYGQVGQGDLDHAFWGRPEDMHMPRPSWKIDREAPGTELACETAAALAAASLVFKKANPDYSAEMLEVAKELYAFGDEHRLEYHKSITDAEHYYKSWSGYGDELLWGALWLYRATGDDTYLTKAQEAWDEFNLAYGGSYGWDDKKAGCYALGMMLDSQNTMYETAFNSFLKYNKKDAQYTPGGLLFLGDWGSLRSAANVAFLTYWAAKYGEPAEADANREWAEGQINYMLGSFSHSFVLGFGVDPPSRPHHRSSSCPIPPESCIKDNWGYAHPGPNFHTLYGALVGGPAEDDTYTDIRGDYIHNEVACDYNAAFVGALAAAVEYK